MAGFYNFKSSDAQGTPPDSSDVLLASAQRAPEAKGKNNDDKVAAKPAEDRARERIEGEHHHQMVLAVTAPKPDDAQGLQRSLGADFNHKAVQHLLARESGYPSTKIPRDEIEKGYKALRSPAPGEKLDAKQLQEVERIEKAMLGGNLTTLQTYVEKTPDQAVRDAVIADFARKNIDINWNGILLNIKSEGAKSRYAYHSLTLRPDAPPRAVLMFDNRQHEENDLRMVNNIPPSYSANEIAITTLARMKPSTP